MANDRGQPTSTDVNDLEKMLRRAGMPEISPELVPKLRAITVATVAQLRTIDGDLSGNRGPSSCILNGTATPGDGGFGLFYWHNTLQGANGAAIDDNGVTYVQVMGPSGQFKTPGAWVRQANSGRLLRSSVLTGTSLAVFPGTKNYRLRLWGGGGGGGGVISAACAAGGGGGAGGCAERFGNPLAATYTFALGAGGTGGSTAGGDGGNGGDSTFSVGGVLVTAPGGSGGKGDAAGTGGATSRARAGGAGGILSTNGTTNGAGAPGLPAIMVRINFADIMATSGSGGSSAYGGGGLGFERSVTSTAAGNAAVASAAGGGGAIDDGTAARAGGAGGAGHGILEEFS